MAYGAESDGLGELEMEFELEGLGEYEGEFENEFEFMDGDGEGYAPRRPRRRYRRRLYRPAAPGGWMPWQGDYDDDLAEGFDLGDVGKGVAAGWNWLTKPDSPQRAVALKASNAILDALPGLASKIPEVGPVLGPIASVLAPIAQSALPAKESEWEFEGEGEFEGSYMANPVSRIYPYAMMEHIGRAAMEAEGEMEAAQHVMALVPIAASKALPAVARALAPSASHAVPHVADAIARATPHLTQGVTNLARTLHRDPRTRPLLRTVPTVARAAVEKIARHAVAGHAVSPKQAVQVLARENHRVLSNAPLVREVMRRAHGMDRQFPQLSGVPVSAARRAAGPACHTCGRPRAPVGRVCGC